MLALVVDVDGIFADLLLADLNNDRTIINTFRHGVTLWVSDSRIIGGLSPALLKYMIIEGIAGIPVAFYHALALALGVWRMLDDTALGHQMLVTGGRREVVRLRDVPVARVRLTALVILGAPGAVAGVVYARTAGSANPSSGPALLMLPAFVASLLGATCIRPERFNTPGSLVAPYFLAKGTTVC